MASGLRARLAALQALLEVADKGRTLSAALDRATRDLGDPRDGALARELGYGVLRWYHRLDPVLEALLSKGLRSRDLDIRLLLLTGLYQLAYTRIPPYAAVDASVAIAQARGKRWARGLVNAVLRGFEREREALLARADANPAAALSHPPWLLAAVRESWPEQWEGILAANNAHPPMSLRVNTSLLGRDDYLQRLREAGLEAGSVPEAPAALVLERAVDVQALPGFAQGLVSVQDAAAQLAAPLMDLRPGQRVLDACAAPGGKTAHIMELQPGLDEVVAVEREPERVARLEDTLARLGQRPTVLVADAGDPGRWWDGRAFDRILLDAPCTATGVIRRHPDIKLLRRPAHLAELVTEQARLLASLWPLLAPGGTLLYATCSVLKEENETQVARFCAGPSGASEIPLRVSWGRAGRCGRQILPGEHRMDGFFYALLQRD